MVDLVFLWHMHQPPYVHPLTGRPALPWVRLHACSGYLDMARALERHPEVRVTVNFVPCLVDQLESLAAGEKDDLEMLTERPVDTLNADERRRVTSRSFSIAKRAIDERPRFGELAAKRRSKRRLSTFELRDLQCLFLLGWLGSAAREAHSSVDELERKGKSFTEDDKAALLHAVRSAASSVLPAWRRLVASGQVELSTSPYYHPIVPLLIDSDVALRARPGDRIPPRFAWSEDAKEQIARAVVRSEQAFGVKPRGMWPPEGSLSPEAVELYRACGVTWLAGDQATLEKSIGCAGHGELYRYAEVDLVFRDRDLSDRIGFRYANVRAEEAAADLVAGACASSDGSVVGIFLDGENPWEAYPRRGADFLDALYGRLEKETRAGRVRAATMSDAIHARGPARRALTTLHSGSWIEASFRIWIGDGEKNRAWTQLLGARTSLAEAAIQSASLPDERLRIAREHLLIAEASDWFWWFGEPNSSAEDPMYAELFQAHLAAATQRSGA